MAPHLQRVLDTRGIDPIIIDPAMVYEAGGDVFRRFVDDVNEGAIRIVGSEGVRWPRVHREDLANLYALMLENGVARASYIGSAISGFSGGLHRARSRYGSVCTIANHKSFPQILLPPNLAIGPGAMRSINS